MDEKEILINSNGCDDGCDDDREDYSDENFE